MAVALSCPHCQTQLKLNRQPPSHKKSARCPKCKGSIPLTLVSDEQDALTSKRPPYGVNRPDTPEKKTQPKQDTAPESKQIEESFLAPPQQPDELGRLGHFRVLSRIGVGGMGMVYSAEDTALKRQVALKVMLPQFASNPIRKERFLREAHAQAKVEHEHIVVIFDARVIDGVSCIIMPLLKGQTLFSALLQNPQPPLKEALRIGREMAEGLAAAHEVGLIHRDIKPSNVWLDGKRRRVKILDFGLARAADANDVSEIGEENNSSSAETDDVALTVQGAVLGTPLYMSPEQARGEKIDPRTDLFSLGVVLYEMTTGSLPFPGTNKPEILLKVINHEPPAPREENPDLPLAVSDYIMRLLAKPVVERPVNAEEVAETLLRLESTIDSTDSQAAVPVLAVDDPWEELDPTEPGTLVEPVVARTASEPRKAKPNKTKKRSKAARKSGSTLIIGVIAGIIGGAVLVGVLVSSLKRPPQPQPQSQPDPEPVASNGTTPPTPPSKPPAAVKKSFWPADALRECRITLMDLSAVKVLKMDDFDDRASGWPHGKSEIKGATAQRGYKDGIYYLQKDNDSGPTYVGNAQLGAFSNFVCQVDGRVVSDPAANWELWFGNDQQRKALTVKINSAGKLTVGITENDKGEPELLFSGTHDAIRKGYDFNKLAAIYTADRLEVFVNGVAVCDPLPVPVRLQPVNIALGVSGGGKSSAEFRRLTVWTADGLQTPEERLKSREIPVKDSFRLPFVWPVAALRDGRISLPDLGKLKLLKTDEFTDPLTGWPVGKSESAKGNVVVRGYKNGTYFIRKDYNNGWTYGGSKNFIGYSSFVCQVEGRIVDDTISSWDLWFGSDTLRKAITVRLNGVGRCRVVVWDYDKGDQTLLFSGVHAAIAKGHDFNKLTVIYTADRLEIFVNGVAVCDPIIVPLRLQPVRIALGESGMPKDTAEFRRLSIWSADGLPKPEER